MWKPGPVSMSYGQATEEDLEEYPVVISGTIYTLAEHDRYNDSALSTYDFSQAKPLRSIFRPPQPGYFYSTITFADNCAFRTGFVADWFSQFEKLLAVLRFIEARLILYIAEEGYYEVPELNVIYHCDNSSVWPERRIDRWVFEASWFPSTGERIYIGPAP